MKRNFSVFSSSFYHVHHLFFGFVGVLRLQEKGKRMKLCFHGIDGGKSLFFQKQPRVVTQISSEEIFSYRKSSYRRANPTILIDRGLLQCPTVSN